MSLFIHDARITSAGDWRYEAAMALSQVADTGSTSLIVGADAEIPTNPGLPILSFPGAGSEGGPRLAAVFREGRRRLDLARRLSCPVLWAGPDRAASGLSAILKNAGATPQDRLLIRTATPEDTVGAVAFAGAVAASERPILHLLFEEEPVTAPALAALRQLQQVGQVEGLHLWAATDELAAHYEGASGLPFDVLAHPVAPQPIEAADRSVLAYVGSTDLDQGFDLLADLAEALSATRPGWLLRVLAPVEARPMDARCRLTLGTLQRLGPDIVEFTSDPRTLLKASALVLPRDPGVWRRRLVPELVQALCAGRPAVVPGGTWMARKIGLDAGTVFESRWRFVPECMSLIDNLEALAAGAKALAPVVSDRHHPATVLGTLYSA